MTKTTQIKAFVTHIETNFYAPAGI